MCETYPGKTELFSLQVFLRITPHGIRFLGKKKGHHELTVLSKWIGYVGWGLGAGKEDPWFDPDTAL